MAFDSKWLKTQHLVCKSGFLTVLALIIPISFLARNSLAQPKALSSLVEPLREDYSDHYLPKERIPEMARKLALPEDDLRVQMLFSERAEKRYMRKFQKEVKFYPYDARRLIGHFRSKKKSGEAALTKEEITKLRKIKVKESEFTPTVQQLKEEYNKLLEDHHKKVNKLAEQLDKPVRLYRCKADQTKNKRRDHFPKSTKLQEQTVVDVLFVSPREKIPPTNEAFGIKTEIHVYDPNKSSSYTRDLVKALKVPCLPYRKRHTKKYLFEHLGEHALRNYDGNPHGKGENYLK